MAGINYLGDSCPDGVVMGNASTVKLGFYGNSTPIAQRSGSVQAAITRGQANGTVFTYCSSQSPTSILTITSTEKSMTVTGLATTDFVYINKPTSQAGLGVGNVRVSAANTLGVTFTNFTGATITPTSSQLYGVIALRGLSPLSATLTPAAVATNTTSEQQFTVTGLMPGMIVNVIKPTAQAGLDIAGCRVVSNNTIGITFTNVTAATITPTAAEVYKVFGSLGMDAAANVMVINADCGTPSGTLTVTTAEQAITAAGLATTDTVIGVTKPTAQAGLGIAGWRVSAAGVLGVTFINPTAGTLTATASELYGITIFRPNPAAALVLYSSSVAPTSVAANTTAEQTFTVTGLVSGSAVWVNKPTSTAGLGIMGVRVSATDTLAINFTNSTATAIVPPTETYTIGNFQMVIPDTKNNVEQKVSPANAANTTLTNEIRTTMVNTGMIAGS